MFKDGVKAVGGILDVVRSPRTICINKFIDCKFCQLTLPEQSVFNENSSAGTGAHTSAGSDSATTKAFDFLCAISFDEPTVWLTVYCVILVAVILLCMCRK
jgi:hypothetical protein